RVAPARRRDRARAPEDEPDLLAEPHGGTSLGAPLGGQEPAGDRAATGRGVRRLARSGERGDRLARHDPRGRGARPGGLTTVWTRARALAGRLARPSDVLLAARVFSWLCVLPLL